MAALGSNHAWHPDNLRLFYDPAYGQFEPIPWDYGSYPVPTSREARGEPPVSRYGATFLAIPEFRRMRDVRLWEVLEERVDPMIAHAEALFAEVARGLEHDPRHPDLDLDRERQARFVATLRENRRVLREWFAHNELRARTWIDAEGRGVAALENHGKSFVEVRAARIRTAAGELRTIPFETPVVVDGLWREEPGRTVAELALPQGSTWVGLDVRDGVRGVDVAAEAVTLASGHGAPPASDEPVEPSFSLGRPGVRVEPGRVTFGPGVVPIEGRIEIPASHDVVFAPGLDLRMGEGAALLIYGNLRSEGTAQAPIRVGPSAPGVAWGAVAVQGTRQDPRRVSMAHTSFSGGTGAENARTEFTGSFSVYGGIVTMRESAFRGGRAIDGINLKYCDVDLEDVLVADSADDAVDCDFCRGELRGTRVQGSGGDGIDFSGSDVRAMGSRIEDCSDKGFSVGENTRATLVDSAVHRCRTGIAVKDLSDAHVQGADFSRLEVGFALYVKKPTFGPSRARVEGVGLRDVQTVVVRDEECVLEDLDGSATRREAAPLQPTASESRSS